MPGLIVRLDTKVIKVRESEAKAQQEFEFLQRAYEAGLAPAPQIEGSGITLERHTLFHEAVVPPSKESVVEMIQGLHEIGICHRDVHEGNILVSPTGPLLIDFEFAIYIKPKLTCYDLYGPSPSIEVPRIHRNIPYTTNGVWWDNGPRVRRSMRQIYGPLNQTPS